MKLNLDCMRDILLQLEASPFNETVTLPQLHSALPAYSDNDLIYSVLKLQEAGYISAVIQSSMRNTYVDGITDITFEGHQFLADIRSDSIWKNVKEVSQQVGSDSLQALSKIAISLVTTLIGNKLGL